MTKKRFGGEDDKWLAEWKTDLASGREFEIKLTKDVHSPEEMEIVGGGGAVGHDVIDVDQLLD